MNYEDYEELLSRHGWTINSYSPLEIEHPEDGTATGYAAQMVLKMLIAEFSDEYESLQDDITKAISFFEEGTLTPVSCFLILHDSNIGENQLLEISSSEYKFVPSSAQILDSNSAPIITRMQQFQDNDDNDDCEQD